MSLQRYVRQLKPIQENKTDYVNVVQDLLEAKIKAEDYEAAIVIGWHENNGIKFNLSSSGISPKVYKTVMSNPQALDAGKKMAQQIAKHFGNAGA